MSIRAIRNQIIFQFEKEIVRTALGGRTRTQFHDKTDWGFDLGKDSDQYDKSAKDPQWGVVVGIGHEVKDIAVGNRVLIEPLKWTVGVDVDENTFWRTDESCILAVDDTPK